MKIFIFIISLLVGIMFGGMVLGFIITAFKLELGLLAKAVIFLIAMILGTWGIRREINGD